MKKMLLFLIVGFSLAVQAQTLESVTPNVGNRGQTLNVSISGTDIDFYAVSASENVSFYNSAADEFFVDWTEYDWDSSLTANITIPTYVATGVYDLRITNPDNGAQYLLPNAFTVTDNYNTIAGQVTVDVNGNGCDAADLHMGGIKLSLTSGSTVIYTFTDPGGNYSFSAPAGNFTVAVVPEVPNYTGSPPSSDVIFPTDAGIIETRNFCLLPAGTVNDLEVTILPLWVARPGFDADYRIVYKNKGNQLASGTLSLSYDDSRIDLVSSSVSPSTQTIGNLTWNYVGLNPFETRYVDLVFNVNSPMESPAVNNGDILNFSAVVNPVSGDQTTADNTDALAQIVVGSYDPNDKAVAEGSQIHISQVGEYLHYLIRFQNTGTFAAENVRIVDNIRWNLDKSTLQVVSASHPYRVTMTDEGKLEFWFDTINLPTEDEDEPGSNGFVAFKIKPSAGAGLGATFYNQAEIYFDFNYPIITNTVSTTVTALSTAPFSASDVVLYPNPVTDVLNFHAEAGFEIRHVTVLDLNGRIVLAKKLDGSEKRVSVGHLNSGVYILEAESEKGKQYFRVVKE